MIAVSVDIIRVEHALFGDREGILRRVILSEIAGHIAGVAGGHMLLDHKQERILACS